MKEIVIDKREVYTEYREIGIKTFKIEKTQSSKLDLLPAGKHIYIY